MSTQAYRKAVRLMGNQPNLIDFSGPCSETLIQSAEIKLGVKFPLTYRQFLMDYGAGSFGSTEIYGIIKNNFAGMGVPSVIGVTLSARKSYALPETLVVIAEVGDGQVYCLDCSQEGEGPVIVYWSTFPQEAQPYELEAEGFGEFLLDQVELSLEIEGEAE